MKRLFNLFLALTLLVGVATAQSPKREVRQLWFTTYMRIDWPSTTGTSAATQKKQKAEFDEYLANFDKRNFNGICIQVRSLCDAMYKSSYEPWSVAISGTRGVDPGWDPLAYAVEECHKRGIECWAWVNPFRQRRTKSNYTTSFDKDWANRGMLLTYNDDSSSTYYTVMDPSNAEARAHNLKVIKEIYTNYAVDGLLFDDYFYPNNIPENNTAGDYNTWKNSGTKLSFGDWRRENINSFMRELKAQIDNDRPDLRWGVSPAGVAYLGALSYGYTKPKVNTTDWQYGTIYSDPCAWIREGSVDFISPQIYWLTTNGSAPYGPLTEWWSQIAHDYNRHFYSSQASYRISDGTTSNDTNGWSEMALQVKLNRQYNHDNAPGSIWYSSKYFDGPTCTGMGQYLADNVYQNRALMPIKQWIPNPGYNAPAGLALSGTTLSWNKVNGKRSNSIIRYTVYAIPQSVSPEGALASDGDGIDGKYLLGVSYDTNFTVPTTHRTGYWYAVCTYDGYGYESTPAEVNYAGQGEDPHEGVGNYESGYTIKKDTTEYPNSGNGNLTLNNLWMRSIRSEYGNISFDQDGLFNRGMAIAGDYVYLAGRKEASSTSDIYLAKYDLFTGEHIGDLPLSAEGKCSYFPCNDVLRDDAGNICITNLVLNASTAPLKIHLVDLTNGKLTEAASLKTTESVRVDHAAVYGDVASGNFTVFAAQSSGTTVWSWAVKKGVAATPTKITVTSFAKAASNFGIAAHTYAQNDHQVWVDGASVSPLLYDMKTGNVVQSYASNTAIAPKHVAANGMTRFTLNGQDYTVVSSAKFNDGNYDWRFNITGSGSADTDIANHKLLWEVPAEGLGQWNPGIYASPCDAVVRDNKAYIATYAGGNGLAVYTLEDRTASSVAAPATTTNWQVRGRSVRLGSRTHVKVYTMSGAIIADRVDGEITLPASGTYIISTPEGTRLVSVR